MSAKPGSKSQKVSPAGPASNARLAMADIARICGYSRTTVSAVLNGKPGVTARARDRILAIVAEHQYRPSAVATMLVGKPSRLVGIVMRDMENPYFTRMFSVIEARLTAKGYDILYFNTRENAERERDVVEQLASYPVAGIILAPLAREVGHEHLELLTRRNIPVLVTERIKGMSFGFVDFKDLAAGRLAGRLLAQLGHREITCLAGPVTSGAAALRWTGFVKALSRETPCVQPRHLVAGSSWQGGYAAAMELLKPDRNRPTAIFCFNDLVAIGVYKAAYALGLRIPRDLSVIGCDDIDTAEVLGPALTSISFGITRVGEFLANALLDVIAGKQEAVSVCRVFEPRLIERQSTGPAPLSQK